MKTFRIEPKQLRDITHWRLFFVPSESFAYFDSCQRFSTTFSLRQGDKNFLKRVINIFFALTSIIT